MRHGHVYSCLQDHKNNTIMTGFFSPRATLVTTSGDGGGGECYLLLECSRAGSLRTLEKLGNRLLNPESDPNQNSHFIFLKEDWIGANICQIAFLTWFTYCTVHCSVYKYRYQFKTSVEEPTPNGWIQSWTLDVAVAPTLLEKYG